jgi:hypothetical protein
VTSHLIPINARPAIPFYLQNKMNSTSIEIRIPAAIADLPLAMLGCALFWSAEPCPLASRLALRSSV